MNVVRELLGWIRIYIGGLPWRAMNSWLGRDRATGKMSPRVVLLRGGHEEADGPWEFSALLRGRGVYTQLGYTNGAGGGSGASMPHPIWASCDGPFVEGAVARSVTRVEVKLDNDERVRPRLLGHGFPARFFLAQLPDQRHAVSVAAVDQYGQVIKEVRLWREPPGGAADRSPLPSAPPQLDPGVQLEVPRN